MTAEEELAAGFETQRSYLHAIAFRVLGSHADADDAVQEAWLRLARTSGGGIEDLRGWLTTVTGRICLDVLRRRGARAEQPLEISAGLLAREAAGDGRTGPEEEALLADSVGLALYVVMDALTPAERVSFVLHDVFEVPFGAIATILGRSTAATKMLASRARGRIRLGPPAAAADAAAREVIDAFYAAAGRGDLAGLLAVLAPEAELRMHGPEGTLVVRGAGEVAARATMGAPGRAGASGAHRRCPGRPHHGGRAAGHDHGLHGRGRRYHRDPDADRPGPAGPGRPLVGRVTMGTGLQPSDHAVLRRAAVSRGVRLGGGWCSRPGRVYDLQTAMAARGGISMTLYMYQASYTAKSMAAQLTDPHDPMEAIGPTLEELGARVLVAGFPFGEYDVLIVYEAADDVTAASVAMAVAAAGEVKSAKTTRLLSGQEWLESLRKRRIVTRKLRQPHDLPPRMPEP